MFSMHLYMLSRKITFSLCRRINVYVVSNTPQIHKPILNTTSKYLKQREQVPLDFILMLLYIILIRVVRLYTKLLIFEYESRWIT